MHRNKHKSTVITPNHLRFTY